MATTLANVSNAVSSWEVVTAFETRIKAVIADAGARPTNGFVRITDDMDSREAGGYKPEEGIHIVPRSPDPHVNDGASRYGQRVVRVFEVWIVTVSAADRAGDYRLAMQKHFNLQDVVFNGMNGTPPQPTSPAVSWNLPVGVTLKWIPGGDALRRAKKVDASRFVSAHLFEVVYQQKTQVIAETV